MQPQLLEDRVNFRKEFKIIFGSTEFEVNLSYMD